MVFEGFCKEDFLRFRRIFIHIVIRKEVGEEGGLK